MTAPSLPLSAPPLSPLPPSAYPRSLSVAAVAAPESVSPAERTAPAPRPLPPPCELCPPTVSVSVSASSSFTGLRGARRCGVADAMSALPPPSPLPPPQLLPPGPPTPPKTRGLRNPPRRSRSPRGVGVMGVGRPPATIPVGVKGEVETPWLAPPPPPPPCFLLELFLLTFPFPFLPKATRSAFSFEAFSVKAFAPLPLPMIGCE